MIFVNNFAKAESFIHSYSNTIFKPPTDGSPDDTTGAGSRETGSCAEDWLEEDIRGFRTLRLLKKNSEVRSQNQLVGLIHHYLVDN